MSLSNRKKHESPANNPASEEFLGNKLSFSATEAYKLLRANLFFCVQAKDDRSCPVIGITSSIQGEGKSTTSINLSYMIAEDGKRVCLIEGDMRAPIMKSRLKLNQSGGLPQVLAGMATIEDSIVPSFHENLNVLPTGRIPPNPAELLGSERMTQLIDTLRESFDYVLIDLPPVTVVADALAVSGALDGLIVVVEEGITTKRELADAMQRLDVIKEKILGFVVTHAGNVSSKYGKKKYGKYNSYRYGYGYRRKEKDEEENNQNPV